MVRRIKHCSECQGRFISFANKPICDRCEECRKEQQQELLAVQDLLGGRGNENDEGIIEIDDSNDEEKSDNINNNFENREEELSSNSAGSEGGDDVFCSQFVPDEHDFDDKDDTADDDMTRQEAEFSDYHHAEFSLPSANDDEVQGQTDPTTTIKQHRQTMIPQNEKVSSVLTTTSNKHTSSDDICLICGTDLSKLKRRIDHIKRCSKKHNVTGKDVKYNDDFENFVQDDHQQGEKKAAAKRNNNNNINPYTKESDWHGEATIDLQLADQPVAEPTSSLSVAKLSADNVSTANGKQTVLSSFFQAPMRSLNNVLLAGARRATQFQQLKKQDSSTGTASSSTSKRKRQSGRSGNNWQPRSFSKKECPMYKKITGTDFVCDGFYYARSTLTQNYFLTHFHSDHYGGISKSWNHGIIYCSVPTATLVTQQLGVDKEYIHPLPMLSPVVMPSRGKPVTVTLIDANHCPGAVMFLFEVGNRTVLHVGDFRWDREFMSKQSSLKPFISGQRVLDKLFLDTTYCDPKYNLPKQKTCIDAIIATFQNELEKPSFKTLHLFGAYTIGKEKMYLQVAGHFKMKVYVDSARYRVLSALNWPKERMQLLTKNKEEASIWVIPLGHINMKKMPEYLPMANTKPFGRKYDRVVGYRPTGWSLSGKPSSSLVSTRTNGNIAIHSVPYSEHSSFPELVDCIECLKPKEIIPTVSVSKSPEQVNMLLKALKQKQSTLPFL